MFCSLVNMEVEKVFFLIILTLLSLGYPISCQDIRKEVLYSVGTWDTSYDLHFGIHREKRAVTDQPATDEPTTSETEAGSTAGDDNTTPPPTTTPTTLPPTTTTNWTLVEDTHEYYTSQVFSGTSSSHSTMWRDKLSYPNTMKHASLSHAHRTAFTEELMFDFPFYGHLVKKITIATGGFLYMSDFVHQWLTATQYIAPLMANFDTRIGNESEIYYVDTGNEFIVWWENLHLNDDIEAGYFTFQARLSSTGVITFAYKKVPKSLPSLNTKDHPVKVGLSDAFYIDEQISENVKRRTIYEYHRVEIMLARIADNGAVLINPKRTCVMIDNCEGCVSADIGFNCHWCISLPTMRCSDGLDRHRQEWLESSCHLQNDTDCSSLTSTTSSPKISSISTQSEEIPVTASQPTPQPHGCDTSKEKIKSEDCPVPQSQKSGSNSGTLAAVIVVVILIVIIIAAVTGWFVYAYRNPNSDSGRWLIEHRPSQIRESLSKVKFWKKDNAADKYGVSVGAEANA